RRFAAAKRATASRARPRWNWTVRTRNAAWETRTKGREVLVTSDGQRWAKRRPAAAAIVAAYARNRRRGRSRRGGGCGAGASGGGGALSTRRLRDGGASRHGPG